MISALQILIELGPVRTELHVCNMFICCNFMEGGALREYLEHEVVEKRWNRDVITDNSRKSSLEVSE